MTYKTGQWGSQAKERSKKRLSYFMGRYRKANPDPRVPMSREQRLERKRAYYYENRTRIREAARNLRLAIIDLLGGKCSKCGFDDKRALHVDHVNGGGTKERKLMRNIASYYQAILAAHGKGKYQLLCANCNWIKRFANNEVRGGEILL